MTDFQKMDQKLDQILDLLGQVLVRLEMFEQRMDSLE